MLQIEAFHPETHRQVLCDWFFEYQFNVSKLFEGLPKLGRLVFDEEGAIAAAFLRKMEGNYYLLDGLIADPKSSGKRRYRALDLAVEAVIREAKRKKCSRILAYSEDTGTLKRSLRHGFYTLPDTLICLALD